MSDHEHANTAAATRLLERADRELVLLARRATLLVTRGPAKGAKTTIEAQPLRVGSGSACDFLLDDPSVSAAHLTLEPSERGFLLRDLGSTNGTFLDGYRVEAAYLPARATIAAGDSTLRFALEGGETEIPLSRKTRFGRLLGHSNTMRQVFAILERVADSESTVLLEGESGTGKELAARAVHEGSKRAGEAFVAVDCGSLPENLIESELFGHAKGAFTGAAGDRPGLFEQADGGTVFLDEIGELPLDMQPKLLRVLETRSVRRLGESQARAIDVRLVAATNRKLPQEVAAGRFREDLYFRLGVIRVRMPSLRERKEEVPRLVAHFLSELGRDPNEGLPNPSMMAMLEQYPWPGNVRELRNVVERLVVLPGMQPEFYLDGESAVTTGSAAADAAAPSADRVELDRGFHEGKQRATERFERAYLAQQLARCRGNISELARVSGLSRQSCHRLLTRHDINSHDVGNQNVGTKQGKP